MEPVREEPARRVCGPLVTTGAPGPTASRRAGTHGAVFSFDVTSSKFPVWSAALARFFSLRGRPPVFRAAIGHSTLTRIIVVVSQPKRSMTFAITTTSPGSLYSCLADSSSFGWSRVRYDCH